MLTLTSPVETAFHRLPAGVKLGAVALGSVLALQVTSLAGVGLLLVGLAAAYLSQGMVFARAGARQISGLWPVVAVILVWHGWTGAWGAGAVVSGRMIFAIGLATLATMTTRLEAMLMLAERALQPLARLGINPKAIALAMALVIRFTPVLLDKAAQLVQAWRARSPRRAGARIVLPVALAALDDAEQVAEALRARGGL